MKYVEALLENAEVQNMLNENSELVEDASAVMMHFFDVMRNYVQENLVEFLDEDLTETSKNIYTFATYATKQMLSEVAAIYGREAYKAEVLKESAKTEFV